MLGAPGTRRGAHAAGNAHHQVNTSYEAIVKGNDVLEPTIPESFKVLVKELHSLGLDVQVMDDAQPISIFDESGRGK